MIQRCAKLAIRQVIIVRVAGHLLIKELLLMGQIMSAVNKCD